MLTCTYYAYYFVFCLQLVTPTSMCYANFCVLCCPVSSIVSPALTCSKKVATLLMRVFGVDMWFGMVHMGMISTGVVVAVVAFLHKCERWRPGAAGGRRSGFQVAI